MSSSLLQDVLTDSIAKKRLAASNSGGTDTETHDSDDELINVVSLPGTPTQSSRPSSRPGSPALKPTRGPASPSRLAGTRKPSRDPLRAFPTDVSQKIFSQLEIRDLARCARVSRKWSKSQTLNYVWFQHYRKENFHDESLPPGKWSKRESKQNWRSTYLQSIPNRSPPLGPVNAYSRSSGFSTPSGYQTPKELREEQWRLEEEAAYRPSKQEMREMYKDLGGRKARNKTKLGSSGGARDKGGLAVEDENLY